MIPEPAIRSENFITLPAPVNNFPNTLGIGWAVDDAPNVFVHSEERPVYGQTIRHMDAGRQQIRQDQEADHYLQYHPPGFN